jgi:hypothetical protein
MGTDEVTDFCQDYLDLCEKEKCWAVATQSHFNSWGTRFEFQPGYPHVTLSIAQSVNESRASYHDLCWGAVSAVAFDRRGLWVGVGWDWFPPSHLLDHRDFPADVTAFAVLSSCAMGSGSPSNNRLPKAWLDRGSPWHVTGTRPWCQLHANQTRNWSTRCPVYTLAAIQAPCRSHRGVFIDVSVTAYVI